MQGAGPRFAPACGDPRSENEVEEQQREATTIYNATDACLDVLERLVSAADSDSSMEQISLVYAPGSSDEMPRDIRGLYNNLTFWIDDTGALTRAGASLDDRLHGHDEIRDVVVGFLQILERNLRRLERNKDQNPIFPNAESQRYLSAIDLALDKLYSLARAIINASANGQSQDLFNVVSDEDKSFHGMAISYVKRKCPNARPSLWEHMGDTISARRRALLHKHRHAEELKTRWAPKPPPAPKPEQRLTPSVEKDTEKLPVLGGMLRVLPSAADSRATQASKMDRGAALQYIHQKPALSIRSSASSQQGVSMSAEYPDPPRIKPGEKHVQCPYCLEPLPAAEVYKGTKNEYWRRHVNQDLKPKHMAAVHPQDWPRKAHSKIWCCDLGHQEPVEFNNETDWRKYMKDLSLHPCRSKPPTAAQLDVLVDEMQKLTPRDPYVCPFCEDKPQSIAILGDCGNSTEMANISMNHIAEHVKSLSFLALPSLGGEAVEDDRSSTNLECSSAKRLRNPGSLPQPPSGAEFLEDISLTFDDDDSEPGSKVHKKPPRVLKIHPVNVTKHSEHDVNPTAETPIPATGPDFSWDFIPRYDEGGPSTHSLFHVST
ncbi:hypothetical protein QBC46DRAFT_354287 [Diplogelasinospora grovesii]|uniref:Uncharacterized protein n=1 Tax=Diplogelasinospora grovesii TaxID=303347 RepID=A0AAN6N6Z1_9PEZI|nr:hypothetical protein QBC46DRAFT_354287 [Diplogelasinospora grovesii]